PHTNHPRRAAISAFGVSGTNAHTILEQAPTPTTTPAEATTPHQTGPLLLPLSAKTPNALHHQAKRLHTHLIQHPELPVAEVAHTLALRRTHFDERAAVVGKDREDVLAALQALTDGVPHPCLVTGPPQGTIRDGKTVFVFPGQGSQYEGMAGRLYATHPGFRRHLDACDEALRPHLDLHVLDVIHQRPGAPDLNRVDVVQPALFAVNVALARTLIDHGVVPDAVMGHSQGEITAAHIAGALTLDDAARLVSHRARALTALEGQGAMGAVTQPHADTARLIERHWPDRLHIAAVNSPSHTIISGDPTALHELLAHCAERRIQARRISVTYASHSPHVEPLRQHLTEALEVTPRPADIAFHSTLLGEHLEDTTRLTSQYWYENLRHTVQLLSTTQELMESGHDSFVEVSPHPVLTGALQETADTHAPECLVVPSLRRDHEDQEQLLTALAVQHTHHKPIDWTHPVLNPVAVAPPAPLPTYPFQGRRYWLAPTPPRRAERNMLLRPTWTGRNGSVDGEETRLPQDTVVLRAADDSHGATHTTDRAHGIARGVLGRLKEWLAVDRSAGSRLVVVTHRAVAVEERESLDLDQAPVWGLVRSVQAEHPDLIVLVDTDEKPTSHSALARAVATGESQLAVRQGRIHTFSLAATESGEEGGGSGWPGGGDGTVLITGGTGALGALTARHLVTRHGITHLLLTSRRGPDAPGATQLHDQLTALGAHVTITACDTTDHTALAHLLTTIPDTHPLTAVIHTAGILDLATVENLTSQKLDAVLRPKVDAAWHLHELTRDLDLDAFVLYSSIAGVLGAPGQANYAAANTYLDALAHHRHTLGLPATSLTWGPWAEESSMVRHLSAGAIAGITEDGFPPLPSEHALALLDSAVGSGLPVLAPTRRSAGPRPSRTEDRTDAAEAEDTGRSLADELASLGRQEQRERITEVVRSTTAVVLAHPEPETLALGQPFKALGFDSLTTVQLRNRLSTVTGLRLPTSLAFDHPTPIALIDHLHSRLAPQEGGAPTGKSVLQDLERVAATLTTLETDPAEQTEIALRLKDLLWQWNNRRDDTANSAISDDNLDVASDEELFEALDRELNTP
ncbi:SDR family NAD(P)-dependent oxidoreductase, partial [Streptomyces sp. NPDC018693]|uniref:SDR family NAD(P)-dependent oxidoreductase n=1 Tax=unclassified Streptomyces TaxID=2593676 RepID=UPI00379F4BB5